MIGFHRAIDEARELVGVLDLRVVDELEFRRVPQLQRAPEFAAQETGGAIQTFADFFRRVLVAERHEPDARARHVGRDTDRGERHIADARIAHFARHQRRQDALHLAFDAGEALRFRTHGTLLALDAGAHHWMLRATSTRE